MRFRHASALARMSARSMPGLRRAKAWRASAAYDSECLRHARVARRMKLSCPTKRAQAKQIRVCTCSAMRASAGISYSSSSRNSRVAWRHVSVFCMRSAIGLPIEPACLEAVAKTQPGAMEQHPEVRRRDGELLADLAGVEFQPLPHHEDTGLHRRQVIAAGLQDLEELVPAARRVRVAPVLRRLAPVAVGQEQVVVEIDAVFACQDGRLARV